MNKKIVWFIILLIFLSSSFSFLEATQRAYLNKVEVKTKEGLRPAVIIKVDRKVEAEVFQIFRPPMLVVDLKDTIHNWLEKELVVEDLLIKGIRSSQFQTKPRYISRVVVDLNLPVDYQVFRKDKDIIIYLSRLKEKKKIEKKIVKKEKVEVEAIPKIEFEKDPVTLHYHNASIRDVLRFLDTLTKVNIIYDVDVAGLITIHLEDVPFDEALETILKLKGLVLQPVGENIVRVITPDRLNEERKKAATTTEIYVLNYAKAEDIKAQLREIAKSDGRAPAITIDSRTNSLIVTATPEVIAIAEQLIAELDRKPLQVLIETKLVEVNLNEGLDLGIDWNFTYSQDGLTIEAETEYPSPQEYGGSLTFGLVEDTLELTKKLIALAKEGKTEVLSNPKISTINNQEARILVGERVPYLVTRYEEGGYTYTTEYIDVGIRLLVTPTINADEKITLKIKPEVSEVTGFGAKDSPIIATREAETTVLINDGETIVIGGLMDNKEIKKVEKVPFLGDLPVIGALFRNTSSTYEQNELLIFVTPSIIVE